MHSSNNKIRIGTRASKLAILQAIKVKDRLIKLFPEILTEDSIEIKKIKTTGDIIAEKDLSEIGDKGLFTKEIEESLVNDQIDIAVHSFKDMPTFLPKELTIDCVLERADPRDSFISKKFDNFSTLPKGAIIGTSSTRRKAILLNKRPDLNIIAFRGNIDTRVQKLIDGKADAILLASCALERINMQEHINKKFAIDEMLPAVSQGVIAIECNRNNKFMRNLLNQINHVETYFRTVAERAFLHKINGGCKSPIAGYAELTKNNQILLKVAVYTPDGSKPYKIQQQIEIDNLDMIIKEIKNLQLKHKFCAIDNTDTIASDISHNENNISYKYRQIITILENLGIKTAENVINNAADIIALLKK